MEVAKKLRKFLAIFTQGFYFLKAKIIHNQRAFRCVKLLSIYLIRPVIEMAFKISASLEDTITLLLDNLDLQSLTKQYAAHEITV